MTLLDEGRHESSRNGSAAVLTTPRLRLRAPRAADVQNDVEQERTQLVDVYARAPEPATPSLAAAVDQALADAAFFAARADLSIAGRLRWEGVATALASVTTDQP